MEQDPTPLILAHAVMEAINSPMLIVDGDDRVLHSNDAYRSAFGDPKDGKLFELDEGRWDLPDIRRALADTREKAGPERSCGLPETGEGYIQLTVRRLDQEGMTVLVFEDVAACQPIEREDEGLWDWNVGTDDIYFSPEMEAIVGYAPGEWEHSTETWEKLIHPEDFDHRTETMQWYLMGARDNFQVEYRILSKGGEWIWLLDRARIVQRDEKGEPVRVVGTCSDITSLKGEEEERAKYAADLEFTNMQLESQAANMVELAENVAELNDRLKTEIGTKNTFFSIIAHDLRSPFAGLMGLTQIMSEMAERFTKEQLVNQAHLVNQSAKNVFELLQNLLEWSRQQMEGASVNPEPLSLAETATTAVSPLLQVAETKGVTIANDVPDLPAFADPDMVITVIRNLIANAVKFSKDGDTVHMTAEDQGGTIRFTVRDEGTGIPEAIVDNLFLVHIKTTTPGTGGEKGTGIGLPLCHDLIIKNKGKIWAESKPGAGAKFHFTLPKEAPPEAK